MKNVKKLMVALAFGALEALAGNGDWAVVLADKAGGHEQKYAYYVASVMSEVLGARVPYEREALRKSTGRAVFIGRTAAARQAGLEGGFAYEEYVVRSVGSDVVVTGDGSTGCVYAMFEFLEKGLGVQHFDPWNRYVPKNASPDLAHLNVRRTPDFKYRHIFDLPSWGPGPHEYRAALKASSAGLSNPIYGSPGTVHTFYDFQQKWPTNRTEWLAKDTNGVPRKLTGKLGPCFCLTNPEACADFRRQLLGFIRSDAARSRPAPFLYNVSQNDAAGYFCKCSRCQEIERKGGASALLLNFINELAAAVPTDRPDVRIETFAYEFNEAPPTDATRAADNVVIELTHTKGNYYSPVGEDDSSPFRSYLDGWCRRAKELAVWDYWVFYWDKFPSVYHNVSRIPKDIRFYREKGVRYLRIESEACDTASFFALKNWLGFRLMDDASADEKVLLDTFFARYYGAAGGEMRELLDYIDERQKGQFARVFGSGYKAYEVPPRPWLDKAFFARTDDIFARAEAKLAPDDPARINVGRERVPVDITLMRLYDEIAPSVSREDLAARYEREAGAFARQRERPERLANRLLQIKSEADNCRKADEIKRVRETPRPRLTIPAAPATAVSEYWHDNNGFRTDRDLRLSASVRAGRFLEVRLGDFGLGQTKPVAGRNVWDADDWEIFLMDRKNDYLQVLVDPTGRTLVCLQKGDEQKVIDAAGITVDSRVNDGTWGVRVTFDLAVLPLKGFYRGDFFRATPTCKYAWAPTNSIEFRLKNMFGYLDFAPGSVTVK